MNLELTDLTVPAGEKAPAIIRLVPPQAKIPVCTMFWTSELWSCFMKSTLVS